MELNRRPQNKTLPIRVRRYLAYWNGLHLVQLSMKAKDVVHFEEEDYLVRKRHLTDEDLEEKIHAKRQEVAAAAGSLARDSVGTVHTGGLMLPMATWDARNMYVENKKLAVLEQIWAERGKRRLPTRHVRDRILPAAMAVFNL